MNFREQFRKAHPETIGETDSAFDNSNYIDWLEKTLLNAIEDRWINPEDELPDLIKGQDYSENVFAIVDGELKVMCLAFIHDGDGYYAWTNCYGDIHGDGKYDDQYEVTAWRHFPALPTPPKG